MPLLFEDDYEILKNSGIDYEEDEKNRFLILKNFPLLKNFYKFNEKVLDTVEILFVVPPNYNSSGGDMFWTYPHLSRVDGKVIPQTSPPGGGDPRNYGGKEYCRWSRHWKPETWKVKEDNIQKILDRIEWALKKPDANK